MKEVTHVFWQTIFFLSKHIKRHYENCVWEGDVCVLILFTSDPEPDHFWRFPLLCSTRWMVSCLDSLTKLVLTLFLHLFFQLHKELLCLTSKFPQYADSVCYIFKQDNSLPAILCALFNRITHSEDRARRCHPYQLCETFCDCYLQSTQCQH